MSSNMTGFRWFWTKVVTALDFPCCYDDDEGGRHDDN